MHKRFAEVAREMRSGPSPTSDEAVFEEWLARIADSDASNPSDALPDELTPELAHRVRGVAACLRTLNEACRQGLLKARDFDAVNDSNDGVEQREEELDRPFRIGRFEIVRELGRGGHGVVFLAFDPQIQRQVALKVPRPEALVSPDFRHRFIREAQAAGSLDHPNVVSVYEAGEAGPLCFIASAFCDGRTLREYLATQGGTLAPRLAAQMIAELAEGVEHAHRRGVLHRDIKPSNILLANLGAADGDHCEAIDSGKSLPFVPKLMDFGLAKLVDRDCDWTKSGVIVGTPAYLAPEQASGRCRDAGVRTDIYGLGVVLFEAIVGRPPFQGLSDVDTIHRVVGDDPPRVRKQCPAISRDLEAICLKCLEKVPAARYGTAEELAADLRRFLRGDATAARPLTKPAALCKWARRRPAQAALLMVSALGLAVISLGGWYSSVQIQRALEIAKDRQLGAEDNARRAQASELNMRRLSYSDDIRAAQQAWNGGRYENSRDLLARHIPRLGEPDVREFSWYYLWNLVEPKVVTLSGHEGDVYRAVASPDEKLIVTCGKDMTVRLWDSNSGQQQAIFTLHAAEVNHVEFSPDGKCLSSVDDDGLIAIHDVASHRLVRKLYTDQKSLFACTFSPDSRLLAAGGKGKRISVWDTKHWTRQYELIGHADFVQCLAFSADGKRLASGGEAAFVWDMESGKVLQSFKDSESLISAVLLTPDGGSIVTSSRDGVARMRRLGGVSEPVVFDGQAGPVHGIALARGGEWLATASRAGKVIVWDTATRRQVRKFGGHAIRVWSVRFMHDDTALLTASSDGTAKISSLPDSQRALRSVRSGIAPLAMWYGIDFSPDGKRFAAVAGHPAAEQYWSPIFDVPSFRQVDELKYSRCNGVKFGGSGEHVVGSSTHPAHFTLNFKTGIRTPRALSIHPHATFACEPHGSLVVVGGKYPLQLWDVLRQEVVGTLPGDPEVEVYQMEFDPSGKWLAIPQSDFTIRVWDFAARRLVATFSKIAMPQSTPVAFLPSGDLLSAGLDGEIHRWSVAEERHIKKFSAEMPQIHSLAVDPTGRTLAVGGTAGASVWDLETSHKLLTFPDAGFVRKLDFSPDGRFLAAGSNGGNLLLWDAPNVATTATSSEKVNNLAHAWKVIDAPKSADSAASPDTLTVIDELNDIATRYRRVRDWAVKNQFSAAFPTFEDQETDGGLRLGVVALLRKVATYQKAEFDSIDRARGESPENASDLALLQQRSFQWSVARKSGAGYSTFNQLLENGSRSQEIATLPADAVDVRWVPIAELGDVTTYQARMRAIQPYARRLGYVGAFPNFIDTDEAIGVVLIRISTAASIVIPDGDIRWVAS